MFWSLVDSATGSISPESPPFGIEPLSNGLKDVGSEGLAGLFWFSAESAFDSLSNGLKAGAGGGGSGICVG